MAVDPAPDEIRAIRVVIAASESVLGRRLREDLEAAGLLVCAVERDAGGAIEAGFAHQPDVSLLAADLPGSAVATARIAEVLPRTKVVIFAESLDEDECLMHLLAGASGYVSTKTQTAALVAAVRAVVAGAAVVPPELQRRILDELRGQLE